jgi:hypothetical protein
MEMLGLGLAESPAITGIFSRHPQWHRRCYAKAVNKKFFHPKLDPLGVKTGLELAAGGIVAMLLMRWLGM